MDPFLNLRASFIQAEALGQIRHKIWNPVPHKLRKIEDSSSIRSVIVPNKEESPYLQDRQGSLTTFNPDNSAFRYMFTNSNKMNVSELTSSRSSSYTSDKGLAAFGIDFNPSEKSIHEGNLVAAFQRATANLENLFALTQHGLLSDQFTFGVNPNALREMAMNPINSLLISDYMAKTQEPVMNPFFNQGYLQLLSGMSSKDSGCGTPDEEREEQQSKPKCSHNHHNNENSGAAKLSNFLRPDASKKKTRHCNCKNSKCLKLYCECLAHGEYCDDQCNCCDCNNSVEKEEVRAYALSLIMEKKPEVLEGDRLKKQNTSKMVRGKGCNCKKSACLKKYCECYNAGGGCGPHCKCEGCKNPHGISETTDSTKNAEEESPIFSEIAQSLGMKSIAQSEKAFSEMESQVLRSRLLQGGLPNGLPLLSRNFSDIPHSGSLPVLSLSNFENRL